MILNEEYQVTVEKMINEGNALARIKDIPVFIKNACPEDVLKIKIVRINKTYAIGEIIQVIYPSRYRRNPICSLNNVCGSCGWLHIDYDEQLRQKENIVKETLKNIVGFDFKINKIIASPKQTQYRCKVQYPVSQKKSGRIVAGYFKKNSHELVNIKYCPMQNNLINEIMELIKDEAQNIGITGYNEVNNSGLLRHIIFRHDCELSNLIIIFVINSENIPDSIFKLAKILSEKYEVIKGISVNLNNKKTNVISGKVTKNIIGNDYYTEKLKDKIYRISNSSFFQVNPSCAEVIFDKVKDLITKNINKPSILDAYSGVSSFGIWLSSIAAKVTSIEEVKSSSNDAIENAKLNLCNNIEILNGDAAVEFNKLKQKKVKFDVSLIDPPRKGCSIEALENLISLTDKYIIYVSCNVSTLARDLKFLLKNGYSVEEIQPIDMFPNTYHVETIVLLKKTN